MIFKFTAIIKLSEDGNYEITFPAINGVKAKGFTIMDALEKGEYALRKFLEDRIQEGKDIPEDIKKISINTDDIEEVIITKLVIFLEDKNILHA